MNMKKGIVLFVCFTLFVSAGLIVSAKSSGYYGAAQTGCGNCHGSSASSSVTITLTGLPTSYTPSTKYSLTLTVSSGVDGSAGGFNLEVTAGTLSNGGTNVQINSAKDEAVHSADTARSWTMDWTAPAKNTGDVWFYVAGMTPNDDGQKNSADLWNLYSKKVPENVPQNNAPTLSSGSVSPTSGDTTTTFTYTVTYADADSDPASYVKVHIDGDTSGTAMSGSGSSWSYSTTLSAGSHTYYFTASDGTDTARLPASGSYSGPTVTEAPNNAPTLSSGSISPTSGYTTDTFTYTVTYADADSDPATYVKVHIDSDATGIAMSGSGSSWSYSTTLTAGSHTFYFTASDGEDTARDPASGSYSGPTVTTPPPNNAPTLTSGSVSPTTGYTSTVFTYTVTYADADSDPATYVNVHIDGDSTGVGMTAGSGGVYTYSTTLTDGSHTFYFTASDGEDTARDPATGSHSGPTVIYNPNTYATADVPVSGTITGDYQDTFASDDVRETLTEDAITKGKPTRRTSFLEHKWTFSVGSGNVITFNLEAQKGYNEEGDDFDFFYSIDDVYYLKMVTVTNTLSDALYTFDLPSSVSGRTLYVKVMDTDRTGYNILTDSVYIDHMYISVVNDPNAPITDMTTSDISGKGVKFDNNYFFTHANDGNYEAIHERASGGKPATRYSFLEHQWTIDITSGSTYTFFVDAHHTANTETDDFVFAYSTDGVTFTDMVTVTKTTDDNVYQSYTFTSGISGTIYIRVLDTDNTPGNTALDTLYVDHMYILVE